MSEPWWISILKALVIVNVVLGLFAYLTLIERKLMGRMQLRYGPNRAARSAIHSSSSGQGGSTVRRSRCSRPSRLTKVPSRSR